MRTVGNTNSVRCREGYSGTKAELLGLGLLSRTHRPRVLRAAAFPGQPRLSWRGARPRSSERGAAAAGPAGALRSPGPGAAGCGRCQGPAGAAPVAAVTGKPAPPPPQTWQRRRGGRGRLRRGAAAGEEGRRLSSGPAGWGRRRPAGEARRGGRGGRAPGPGRQRSSLPPREPPAG